MARKRKTRSRAARKPLIIIVISVLILSHRRLFDLVLSSQPGIDRRFLHRRQCGHDAAKGFRIRRGAQHQRQHPRSQRGISCCAIDQRDYSAAQAQARAQLALANAQVTTAKEALRIARVQYPAQLHSAQAQQEAAAASLTLAKNSYERQHQVDRRATTQESIDSSTSQQLNAAANLKSAKAQVEIASLVPEQVQQAINTVSEREASVQQATGASRSSRSQFKLYGDTRLFRWVHHATQRAAGNLLVGWASDVSS